MMRKSLGLSGDLDDVELLTDVQEAFDVRLSNDEVSRCRTVGDLFALVSLALPSGHTDGARCAEAMCFYRLRRAILTLAPHLHLSPSSPLSLLRGMSVRRLYRAIRRTGGLRPPPPYLSVWGGVSLLLVLAAPAGPFLLGAPWWLGIVWMIAAATCFRLAPVCFPPDLSTFGDLVELVTARSIGVLAAEGARLRPVEAWKALASVCASHSATTAGEIGGSTLLLK